jgi:hypothetical protein
LSGRHLVDSIANESISGGDGRDDLRSVGLDSELIFAKQFAKFWVCALQSVKAEITADKLTILGLEYLKAKIRLAHLRYQKMNLEWQAGQQITIMPPRIPFLSRLGSTACEIIIDYISEIPMLTHFSMPSSSREAITLWPISNSGSQRFLAGSKAETA